MKIADTMFVADEINPGKQAEFDLSRAISCVLMVACHVGIYLTVKESHPAFYKVMDLIGNEFAAPVFMALLGACICFSRKCSFGQLFNRGLVLILMGVLLNLFRGYIPNLFLQQMNLVAPGGSFVRDRALWDLDIFHFAGLAFMAFAILRKFRISPFAVFFLSLPLSLVGELLLGVQAESRLGECLCNLFWYGNSESYFPFFNWFVFPAFGYMFGSLLKHCQDKDRFYRMLMPIGLFGVVAVYAMYARFGMGYHSHSTYYTMGVRSGVMSLFFVIFSLSSSHFLSNKLRDGIVKNTIGRYSRNLTSIYCISYVIIGSLLVISLCAGYNYEPPAVVALIPAVMGVSDLLAVLYKKVKQLAVGDRR